jgi:hypothetical protein
LEINLLELEIDFTILPDFELDIPELDLTKLYIEMPEINIDFPKMNLPEMIIDISEFLKVLNFDLPDLIYLSRINAGLQRKLIDLPI